MVDMIGKTFSRLVEFTIFLFMWVFLFAFLSLTLKLSYDDGDYPEVSNFSMIFI